MDFLLSCLFFSQCNHAWPWHTFLDSVPLRSHIFPFICYFTDFFPRISCIFCRKCNFCRSRLCFHFWNFMIFFNFAQMFPTSKFRSGSVSAPRTACTSFVLFLNRCFTFIYSHCCRIRSPGFFFSHMYTLLFYISTHPLGHTGPVTGSLYLYTLLLGFLTLIPLT